MSAPRLDGRRVLVTGSSRGIGREVANAVAEAGASVIAISRRGPDIESAVAGLPGTGHDALAMDVSDESAWREAASAGRLAGVDGVVTAAAVLTPVGPLGSYTPAEFWETMRVNVLGMLMAAHFCRASLEERGGAIVTFAGGGATGPQPRYDAYATSKAAVVRLTENLASELAPRGVRINAVSPGFVATEMHAATLDAGPELAGEDYFVRTRRELEGGGAPARRAAELTGFLLSAKADGITGRCISAQWDPWDRPDFQRRLREEPDLARIRRIDDQFFGPVQRPES